MREPPPRLVVPPRAAPEPPRREDGDEDEDDREPADDLEAEDLVLPADERRPPLVLGRPRPAPALRFPPEGRPEPDAERAAGRPLGARRGLRDPSEGIERV